mmetsp:Transcript_45985/g.132613  ORF Transcript_45985/g.132613 Transcript_45985/m.132613 type:complete len:227 (+) Transcript_45985:157-837(+)
MHGVLLRPRLAALRGRSRPLPRAHALVRLPFPHLRLGEIHRVENCRCGHKVPATACGDGLLDRQAGDARRLRRVRRRQLPRVPETDFLVVPPPVGREGVHDGRQLQNIPGVSQPLGSAAVLAQHGRVRCVGLRHLGCRQDALGPLACSARGRSDARGAGPREHRDRAAGRGDDEAALPEVLRRHRDAERGDANHRAGAAVGRDARHLGGQHERQEFHELDRRGGHG